MYMMVDEYSSTSITVSGPGKASGGGGGKGAEAVSYKRYKLSAGRIDKQIFLGFLETDAACDMIAHYFGVGVTDAQRLVISSLLGEEGLLVTPAQMEQQCAEHETVDELLDALGEALRKAAAGI